MPLTGTMGAILETQADKNPDAPFLTVVGQASCSFGDFNKAVNQAAHGLRDLFAIGPGDCVAIMMRNSIEFCIASYALKKLGAVEVAINTDFRGPGLAHAVNLTGATIALTDAASADALSAIADSLSQLASLVVTGDDAPSTPARYGVRRWNDCLSANDQNPARGDIHDGMAAVLFTSGTTGPSKGCMLSHKYATTLAEQFIEACRITSKDCLYCPFPLYHIDAAYLTVLPALMAGCRAVISPRFSASRFWDEVRSTGTTVFDFMGATLTIMDKQPPRPDDADNPVRLAWGVPMPSDQARHAFEERFGLHLVHNYGLTDGGCPCWESLDVPEPEGSCGIPRYPFDVQIVDEHDSPLEPGSIGEIVIRPLEPDVTMRGYWGMPEQTAEIYRNGMLHTGDLGRMDDEGHLFFVSRRKDVIRRRGQNVSAWEVEQVVLQSEKVAECTALAVPSELSEDEVKIVIVLRDGAHLTLEELQGFCAGKMASYMIPQILQIVDEIPKTPTGKAQRYKLENGV